MKTIQMNPFDTASIERAIADLEKYRDSLPDKENKLKRKLLREGREVAIARFEDGVNMADTPNAMPSVTVTGNGLRASGEDVGFLEFGTGVSFPEWGSGGSYGGYTPPAHGSYGKGNGKNPNGWWYDGKKTYGQYPAEAMLGAWQRMKERISTSAREVFDK